MLTASFAKPTGLFDNFFNKFVTYVTAGDHCHSEFVFSFDIEEARIVFRQLNQSKLEESVDSYEEDGQVHLCIFVLWGLTTSYRFLRKRSNNPFYKFPNSQQFSTIEMNLTRDHELKVLSFLLDQTNKPYDYLGALTYFVPFRNRELSYNSYFCSQLMVTALQHVDRFKDVNAAGVTPNKLYTMLKA